MYQQGACCQGYSNLDKKRLYSLPVMWILGMSVPIVILGDPVYLLLPWLMKLPPDVSVSGKRRLNYRLSSGRIAVECVVG